MRFRYDRKLKPLLARIEDFLVAHVPPAVATLKITGPAYALFLWYDDSSALPGHVAPDFGVGTEALRAACRQRYDERASVNDCIWRPQQVILERLVRGRLKDPDYRARCNEAYELMWAANPTGEPLDEEDDAELLRPFRAMMQRVASRLNGHNWESLLKATDDFVVVTSDRIGYWLDEDLAKSVPPPRRRLLKQRGLLPGQG